MPFKKITSLASESPALFTGLGLLFAHSAATLVTFAYCWANCGVAQIEFVWFTFDYVDWPSVPLAFHFFGSILLMQAIFDHGYSFVCSGPNLRAAFLVGFAGGFQWLFVGSGLGVVFSWFRQRAKGRSVPMAYASTILLMILIGAQKIWREWEWHKAEVQMAEPLNAAARAGDLPTVTRLLELGKDVDTPSYEDITPLMSAAYEGHADVRRFLIERGAEVNAKRKYGVTALDGAVLNGHADVVKLLREHGAKSGEVSKDPY